MHTAQLGIDQKDLIPTITTRPRTPNRKLPHVETRGRDVERYVWICDEGGDWSKIGNALSPSTEPPTVPGAPEPLYHSWPWLAGWP
jgi:hypothetical protein